MQDLHPPHAQHLISSYSMNLTECGDVWIEFNKKNFTVKAGINCTVKPLNLGTHVILSSKSHPLLEVILYRVYNFYMQACEYTVAS